MSVTLSQPPGHYLDPITLDWNIGDDVAYISYTTNGAQPTVSKYIAYDTLTPPNPFIAVTQDGRGNVVYDGGFPKFYNQHFPTPVASFAALTPAFKYLHNAIQFVANPTKVAAGQKKWLVLGDATTSTSYSVKGTNTNGFYTSFSNLATLMGYDVTFKDVTDYGGTLNSTLAELEGYALVLLMSSISAESAHLITTAAIANLIAYRENGNGLIVVTDHGPVRTSLEDAVVDGAGFFGVANRLVVNFGAYFSGDYNRTPVNVGFLRNTYGDHPLYNGLSDSENIQAGGSESRVVVVEYPTYTQATAPTLSFTEAGRYTVSVLVVYNDGRMSTHRFVYALIDGGIYDYVDDEGVAMEETPPTLNPFVSFNVDVQVTDTGTLRGGIFKNNKQVGTFEHVTQPVLQWFAGSGETVPVNTGDQIELRISTPFLYSKPLRVNRLDTNLNTLTLARTVQRLLAATLTTVRPRDAVVDTINRIAVNVSNLGMLPTPTTAKNVAQLRLFFSNAWNLPPTSAWVYPDSAATQAGLTTQPTDRVAINAATLAVYFYQNEQWTVVDNVTPQDFLGSPRQVVSLVDQQTYLIHPDGSFTLLQ